MQKIALATPISLGGTIKIAYDILLYSSFRRLTRLEERLSQKLKKVLPETASSSHPKLE